ncbi:hypothetical protein [Viridibacillus arvi]|uniref:hypothetical protein n=1 Tax=Viridibacillus arvi TaxID=263475 RepID=UPI003CFFA600
MKRTLMQCNRNENHKFIYEGKLLDGLRCLECDGVINLKADVTHYIPELCDGVPRYEPKRKSSYVGECLVCGHHDRVELESKEDYREISVCPNCNGAFIDRWKINKYKQKESKTVRSSISVAVDMDTNKLSAKLNAISKHTQALADELEAIDLEKLE